MLAAFGGRLLCGHILTASNGRSPGRAGTGRSLASNGGDAPVNLIVRRQHHRPPGVTVRMLYVLVLGFGVASAAGAEQCDVLTYRGKQLPAETCRALVEETLSAVVDGYRHSAYIVRFRGERVVVADTLALTNYSVGDEIGFLASRFDSTHTAKVKTKALSFEIIAPTSPKPASTPK
jgi:hypothetical protein